MAVTRFAVFEIGFTTGLDKHCFTCLRLSHRGLYDFLWSWCWEYSHAGIIRAEILQHLAQTARVDCRTFDNILLKLCNLPLSNLMEKTDGDYILVGLKEKRLEYYHRKKPNANRERDISGDEAANTRAGSGNKETNIKELKEKESTTPRGVEKEGEKQGLRILDEPVKKQSIYTRLHDSGQLNSYDYTVIKKICEAKMDGAGIFSAVAARLEKQGRKYDRGCSFIGNILNAALCDMPTTGIKDRNKYFASCALNLLDKRTAQNE